MAWAGLIRTRSKSLVVRVEDTPEPRWLVKLYDGGDVIGEESAESPQQAVRKILQLARDYLHDDSVSSESLDWVQV